MESQIVNKKRIYRGFQEGDTGYYKGIKGKISIDKDTPTSFKIDWHSENIPHYECFTLEGKFMKADKEPSLSFLKDEQSMPFDEVEEINKLPEKYAVKSENEDKATVLMEFYDFWEKESKKEKPYSPNFEYISERILIAIAKKEITHKINKIETKLSKFNEKREKLLERYKSLGK